MKQILIALPLLLLLTFASGQSSTQLGVSSGDSFEFEIPIFSVTDSEALAFDQATSTAVETTYYSTTTSDIDYPDDKIRFYNDDYSDYIDLGEGDSFTLTILEDTPTKGDYGDYVLLVSYSNGVKTIETHEYIGFGGPIVTTDWASHKRDLEEDKSEMSSYTEEGETFSYSIIDTNDEFGAKISEKSTYTEDGGYTSSYSGSQEIRYEKSTGILNYLEFNYGGEYYDGKTTHSSSTHIKLIRRGYTSPDTGGGVSLPGFEVAMLVTALISIRIIRSKK